VSIDQEKAWNPKIIVFACNWCTYAAADLAGSNHLHYPEMFALFVPLVLDAWTHCWFCGPLTGGRTVYSYPDDTRVNATMVVAITITGAVIRL
jgi:hypothetical protein